MQRKKHLKGGQEYQVVDASDESKLDHMIQAPDSDDSYNGLTIPVSQSSVILNFLWLQLFSTLVALYRGYYDMAFYPGIAFITSFNYWRNPIKKSWRRYVDIAYMHLCLILFVIRGYGAQYCFLSYLSLGLGSLCFAISGPLRRSRYNRSIYGVWISTMFHAMVHIFAFLANISLYYGEVRSLEESFWFLFMISQK